MTHLDGPVLLFDGVCNLCDRSVQFVLDHDPEGAFRFASLQSAVGRRLTSDCELEGVDSVVLIEDGRCHVRSEAAWRIARRLEAPWRWAALGRALPRALRDRLYDWVARRRYRWFGTRESCRLPTPGVRDRFLDADEVAPSSVGS